MGTKAADKKLNTFAIQYGSWWLSEGGTKSRLAWSTLPLTPLADDSANCKQRKRHSLVV